MTRTLKWKLDCSRIKYTWTYTQNRLVFSLISTHPRRLFEVLRLQRLFQNKKNLKTSKNMKPRNLAIDSSLITINDYVMVFSLTCFTTASYIHVFCTCSMHFGLVTITVRFFQGSLFEGWVPLLRRKHLLKEGAYMSVKPYGAH